METPSRFPAPQSFWLKTEPGWRAPALAGDCEADVVIVGGGITGVTCAYCLARGGAKPLLLEAGGALCAGATGNTTGKVTVQHGVRYGRIAREHGLGAARQYAQSQTEALQFAARAAHDFGAGCGFERSDSFLFATSARQMKEVEKEYETARALAVDAALFREPGAAQAGGAPFFPPDCVGMAAFKNQAVFHPVRYVNALARAARDLGARMCCGTRAARVLPEGSGALVVCRTAAGETVRVRAGAVVLATQYPFRRGPLLTGPGLLFTRLYAKRAYAVAVEADGPLPEGNYISAGAPVRSVRTASEGGRRILIIAGESHPTGRGGPDEREHTAALVEYAARIAPVRQVLAVWSAQDYDTPDGIPYIGRLREDAPVYAAAGYGKWGMTGGTLAGMLLAERILAGGSRCEGLYSPARRDFSSAPGEAAGEVLGGAGELLFSRFAQTGRPEGMRPGEGRTVRYGGKSAGLFLDEGGEATVLSIACTHLSTQLRFNPAEKSWDCPAHGGRFSAKTGVCLEGPPHEPLRVLYRGPYAALLQQESRDGAD